MSKIFDALQGTRSEVSDLFPDLIEDPQGASAARPMLTPSPATQTAEAGETAAAVNESETAAVVRTSYAGGKPVRVLALAVPATAPLLPFENPREHAAEQYRIARTKLTHHPKQPRMIVISSSGAGDGKSLTAINLAGALSLK